jgi:quercetin dioxygenase-like cupin family protein
MGLGNLFKLPRMRSDRMNSARERASVMTKERSAMCVRVEPVVLHQDSRGSVFEPLEPESLPSQRNMHVVVTEPGGVRGNHYHTRGTEVITVQGPALVRIRDGQEIQDTLLPEDVVTRFTIPPGIAHAVQIGEHSTCWVLPLAANHCISAQSWKIYCLMNRLRASTRRTPPVSCAT